MRKKKTRKTVLDKVIPYQSLTGCAFSLRSKRGRKFWARPVKPFGRGRPWLRGTRAVMQIQLREGRGLRFAGAALRSMTHYAAYREIGYSAIVWRKLLLKRLQERICLVTEQRKT